MRSGPIGGEVLVLTELQVREDAWTLFGFGSAVERDSFRALTAIQGVGGRLALAILSVLSPDELARAVAQEDKAMIGRANGVGPKLAARIANELQGKLGAVRSAAAHRRHAAGRQRTRYRHSAISGSSRPKRARRSMPLRTSSAPMRRWMRSVRVALKKAAK